MIESPINFRDSLRSSFQSIRDVRTREGLKKLIQLGGKVILFGLTLILENVGLKALRNKNLSLTYKIVPAILVALASAISLVAGVVVLAGASALIPPFTFVASVIGITRSAGEYFQDRAERNKLRKLLISKKELKEKMAHEILSIDERKILADYIDHPVKIYNTLYSLRQSIIDMDIDETIKQEIVLQINQCIESVHQGHVSVLAMDHMAKLPDECHSIIRAQTNEANNLILRYREVKEAKDDIKISSALNESIEHFKLARAKIYSRDLPQSVKNTLVEMLEKEKNTKNDISNVFIKMANHYVNRKEQGHYPSPAVNFELENFDPLKGVSKRLRSYFFSKIEKQKTAKDFSEQYRSVFEVIKKKERLGYVERSTKQQLVNIGLSAATAVFSIIASGLILSAATPAVPLVIASSAMSAVAFVFTVGSILSAIDLMRREGQAYAKVKKPKRLIKEALQDAEDISVSNSNKLRRRPVRMSSSPKQVPDLEEPIKQIESEKVKISKKPL